MPDIKVKYANFPERELKVVIGPNINATTAKAISRLSIGAYEMSFIQQERSTVTTEAARMAMNHLAKELGLTVKPGEHRDYVGMFTAENADHRFTVWVTTPFELTQSAHVIWAKYIALTGEPKTGVAFKLSTSFACEDVEAVLKVVQKNAEVLEPGAPFTLKGNPPPRFAKKKVEEKAEEKAADADAPAAEAAADADKA
jgi:hypothetical protein